MRVERGQYRLFGVRGRKPQDEARPVPYLDVEAVLHRLGFCDDFRIRMALDHSGWSRDPISVSKLE